MKSDAMLHALFADVLSDNLDETPGAGPSALVEIVRSLDAAYTGREPPSAFVEQTQALLASRAERNRSVLSRFTAVVRERPIVGIPALLLAAVLMAGSAYAAVTATIKVVSPEQGPTTNTVYPPSRPPEEAMRFRPVGPAMAARQSGISVAVIPNIPAPLRGSVATQVFTSAPWEPQVDFHNVSFVRYRSRVHTLVVGMYQLSPRVANRPVLLGERTVQLANGAKAYASIEPQDPMFNWLMLVLDSRIVALYSDLPLAQVEQLATKVTILQPAASRPHIPSGWPAPLPADTPIPGVDLSVKGSIKHTVAGGKSELVYDLRYGNRGSAPARYIMLSIILPAGIDFRDAQATSHEYDIRVGSGNGGIGGTMPIRVLNRQAFRRPVTVWARWGDPAHRGSRIFHFRWDGK